MKSGNGHVMNSHAGKRDEMPFCAEISSQRFPDFQFKKKYEIIKYFCIKIALL